MNVVVKYANGDSINPVYSPEHKDSVIEFYTNLVNDHKAMAVVITMDNGETIHLVEA